VASGKKSHDWGTGTWKGQGKVNDLNLDIESVVYVDSRMLHPASVET
jgi:hypothetical protein